MIEQYLHWIIMSIDLALIGAAVVGVLAILRDVFRKP